MPSSLSSTLATHNLYSLSDGSHCPCGAVHSPLAGMSPESSADWVGPERDPGELLVSSDGGFQPAAIRQLLDRATPEQRALCQDLIERAGGLEAAFSAAFGPSAAEFSGNIVQSSRFNRRDFLARVAATAAIVTLGSCAGQQQAETDKAPTDSGATGKLEKTELTLGFIPIACSIPIVLAEPKGFYEKHGLKVTLKKMPNWAAIRESAIAGELDAYHMLSPMPIAMSSGVGSAAFPVKLASIENINGQSIAVANKHQDKVKGPADFKGMSIGVPFPYSMHNLLLRYYLASGGLDPDRDVKLEIVPPPDSVAKMAAGQLDAFLMPDNFGQRVVFEKVGFIHLLTKDLWAGHPCCAFAAGQTWIDAHPNTFRALNKAIIESAGYADAAANREEVARLMAERKYLNQPEPVLQAVLTGKFDNGLGQTLEVPDRIQFDPYPWKSFAKWITSQMVRWEMMPAEKANYEEIADSTYMTDVARDLAKELGQTPPEKETRVEQLKFGAFDPARAEDYVKAQMKPAAS